MASHSTVAPRRLQVWGAALLPILLCLLAAASWPGRTQADTGYATLGGRILNEAGQPLAGAYVSASNTASSSTHYYAASGSGGTYVMSSVKPGTYIVSAWDQAAGYLTKYYPDTYARTDASPVTASAGLTVTLQDLVLQHAGAIAGSLRDATTLAPIGAGAQLSASPALYEGGSNSVAINTDGTFLARNLPPVPINLYAQAYGYVSAYFDGGTAPPAGGAITVTSGVTVTGVDFRLQRVPGAVLTGQVTLPACAQPVSVTVGAQYAGGSTYLSHGAGSGGSFRLAGLQAGRWVVQALFDAQASCAYGPSDPVTVTVGSGVTDIQLPQALSLDPVNVQGRVLLPGGSPVANSHAYIDAGLSSTSAVQRVPIDGSGTWRMAGARAGTYSMQLLTPYSHSGVEYIAPHPVPFTVTNPSALTVVPDIYYELPIKSVQGSVLLPDGTPVPGASVHCVASTSSTNPLNVTVATNAQGIYRCELAPGAWLVSLSPSYSTGNPPWYDFAKPFAVTFADNNTPVTATANFPVQPANARVHGLITSPSGQGVGGYGAYVSVYNSQMTASGYPKQDGSFDFPLAPGVYHGQIALSTSLYPNLVAPPLSPITATAGVTVELGTIQLVEKDGVISGQVTRQSDGAPLAGVMVGAYCGSWPSVSTTTGADGSYRLLVANEKWTVYASIPSSWHYVGPSSQTAVIAAGQETATVNFQLASASALTGEVVDPQGNIVSGVVATAYARPANGDSPQPVARATVSGGHFSLNVPPGIYLVGLWVQPGSGYAAGPEVLSATTTQGPTVRARSRAQVAAAAMARHESLVRVAADGTVAVQLVVLPLDARIVGTFYEDSAKAHPATGITGGVGAALAGGSTWESTAIAPGSASYSLTVAAGTWTLGYWITSGAHPGPQPETQVTVTDGTTVRQDFVLDPNGGTVQGVVFGPQGAPLGGTEVYVRREASPGEQPFYQTATSGSDGSFSFAVPSGHSYIVGANGPVPAGTLQPVVCQVTVLHGATVSVQLRFQTADGTISGVVYFPGQSGPAPLAGIQVWAYADAGQHLTALTDGQGRYTLQVTGGNAWHVGTAYQPKNSLSYYVAESEVTAPSGGAADRRPGSGRGRRHAAAGRDSQLRPVGRLDGRLDRRHPHTDPGRCHARHRHGGHLHRAPGAGPGQLGGRPAIRLRLRDRRDGRCDRAADHHELRWARLHHFPLHQPRVERAGPDVAGRLAVVFLHGDRLVGACGQRGDRQQHP